MRAPGNWPLPEQAWSARPAPFATPCSGMRWRRFPPRRLDSLISRRSPLRRFRRANRVNLRAMRVLPLFAALVLGLPAEAAKPPAKPKAPQATTSQRTAQSMLKSLSLRDRIAQLVIGVCYGDAPSSRSPELQKYRHWVRDLHIGGLIVNNHVQYGLVRYAEPHTLALFLNQMQKLAKVPLLVGGDFERGSSMRVTDTTKFPYSMAYAAARDVEGSREEGLMTAREARA